jgi:Periplasmic protein TonB, links inner and outer membranes
VEFVVNKNGAPSDLKVTKGIGGGCDEEAMRVIALSKWEPGKQRGNPVRVRMSMAINFKLNH